MSFLLDTNVVSEARKSNADENVRRWFSSVKGADLFLSVLVVGEIRLGIQRLRRRDPAQSAAFEAWLARLRQDYAERILPIDADVAEEWGRINAVRSVPTIDALMAATAKVHGLILVTRNVSGLAHTGVRLLNPFDD